MFLLFNGCMCKVFLTFFFIYFLLFVLNVIRCLSGYDIPFIYFLH